MSCLMFVLVISLSLNHAHAFFPATGAPLVKLSRAANAVRNDRGLLESIAVIRECTLGQCKQPLFSTIARHSEPRRSRFLHLKSKIYSLLKMLLMGYNKKEEMEQIEYEENMRGFTARMVAMKEQNAEVARESASLTTKVRPEVATTLNTNELDEEAKDDIMSSLKRRMMLHQLQTAEEYPSVVEEGDSEGLHLSSSSDPFMDYDDEDTIEVNANPKMASPADIARLKKLYGST